MDFLFDLSRLLLVRDCPKAVDESCNGQTRPLMEKSDDERDKRWHHETSDDLDGDALVHDYG